MSYPSETPKIVLITGATGGFGKAFARRYASAGSRLILAGRNEEKLKALQEELSVDCHLLLFDITNKTETNQALQAIPDAFKNIDVLINNAGGALGIEPAHKANMDDWEAMIEINICLLYTSPSPRD